MTVAMSVPSSVQGIGCWIGKEKRNFTGKFFFMISSSSSAAGIPEWQTGSGVTLEPNILSQINHRITLGHLFSEYLWCRERNTTIKCFTFKYIYFD